MNIGMSIQTEACQIRGKVSRSFLFEGKTFNGYVWSRRRLTKVQTTTRPDHVWPEIRTKIGKAAQNREKQEWKNERPKSTLLEDREEFASLILMTKITKKLSKMRGETWKDLWQQPCRAKEKLGLASRMLAAEEIASHKVSTTISGCIVESHKSTRQRVESSLPTKHEDRIAGKGSTSMIHYNLVHKILPVPQAMKIPDAQAAVDKEWKKTRHNPSMATGECQEQEGGYSRSTKTQKESPLCYIDGHMSLQERGVRTQITDVPKAESCSVVTL